MKKLLMTSLIMLLLVTGCGQSDLKANMDAIEGVGENHHYVVNSMDSMIKKLEQKKDGVYLVTYLENPASDKFVPALDQILEKYDQKAYFIDTRNDEFASVFERYNTFDESLDEGIQAQGIVPVVFIINKGEVHVVSAKVNGQNISGRPLLNDELVILEKAMDDALSK